MTPRAILVDVCLAVGLATAVLILAPGLGVVALLAVFTVLVCAASFGIERARRRREHHGRRLRPGRARRRDGPAPCDVRDVREKGEL